MFFWLILDPSCLAICGEHLSRKITMVILLLSEVVCTQLAHVTFVRFHLL